MRTSIPALLSFVLFAGACAKHESSPSDDVAEGDPSTTPVDARVVLGGHSTNGRFQRLDAGGHLVVRSNDKLAIDVSLATPSVVQRTFTSEFRTDDDSEAAACVAKMLASGADAQMYYVMGGYAGSLSGETCVAPSAEAVIQGTLHVEIAGVSPTDLPLSVRLVDGSGVDAEIDVQTTHDGGLVAVRIGNPFDYSIAPVQVQVQMRCEASEDVFEAHFNVGGRAVIPAGRREAIDAAQLTAEVRERGRACKSGRWIVGKIRVQGAYEAYQPDDSLLTRAYLDVD